MNTMRRTTDRRWQLRDATATAHEELDQTVGSFDDRASYGRYLAGLHAFRQPLEQSLTDVPGFVPTLLASRLAADLADLGLPVTAPAAEAPATGSALLGRLYVLEGAVLGGQILRRRAASIGFDEAAGARHLALPVANWLSFLHLLEETPDYDPTAAVAAANATFALARQAFLKASA